MPALSDWVVAVEATGPDWQVKGPALGSLVLIPGLMLLKHAQMLCTFIRTLTLYLDTQQKWKAFESAEHGLHYLLGHTSASMRSAAAALLEEEQGRVGHGKHEVEQYFGVLKTASRSFCSRLSP